MVQSAMRRWLLSVLAVVLAFSITPGSFEIVENLAHVLSHGDSAHAEDDGHSERSSSDEHGCSGATHACGCCHSAQYVAVRTATLPAAANLDSPKCDVPSAPVADAPVSRVFRPPRS